MIQCVLQRPAMNRRNLVVQQAGAVEFSEDAKNTARAAYVFQTVFGSVGRSFSCLRTPARQTVDVLHRERDVTFLSCGQEVEDSVGGAAHGDVQRHGVFKRGKGGDGAWQNTFVVLLVIAFGNLDNQAAGSKKELFTICVGRQR